MDSITISIRSYDKYQGRHDVKNPSWFRLSNRFLEDPEFYDFTAEEKLVWIYFLSLASSANHSTIHVSVQRAEKIAGLAKSVLTSAIKKLKQINAIELPRTRSVRGRYVDVTDAYATDKTDKTDKTDTPNTDVSVLGATSDFSFFDKISPIKKELADAWCCSYGKDWVNGQFSKAKIWCLANPKRSPKNASTFLTNWLSRGWESHRKTIPSNGPSEALKRSESVEKTLRLVEAQNETIAAQVTYTGLERAIANPEMQHLFDKLKR